MAETDTATALDDETSAALTLFNEYVDANRERTRREKRIKKAERAKDDAAALVKKLASGGSAEQKAEAEAAYREASEAWKRIRDGHEPEAKAEPEAEVETPEPETAEPDGETDRTDDDAEDPAGDSPVAEAPPAD
ncbi:MAG: hypothetical protein P8P85_11560, partial [Acidimicrobiales bacterium]|nr:hypothetical protein [Acidimicrobiales bacterium]